MILPSQWATSANTRTSNRPTRVAHKWDKIDGHLARQRATATLQCVWSARIHQANVAASPTAQVSNTRT